MSNAMGEGCRHAVEGDIDAVACIHLAAFDGFFYHSLDTGSFV